MKHGTYIIISVLIHSLISSCDYVHEPLIPLNPNVVDTALCNDHEFPVVTDHVKKILVEDYTAHGCTGCPKAGITLEELDTTFPNQIVPLAIHCGPLSKAPPQGITVPDGTFTADMRTGAGTLYDNFFVMSAARQPNGMINRIDYEPVNKSHQKEVINWSNVVSEISNDAPTADLQIINDFDNGSKRVCSHLKVTFLSNMNGKYNLAVLLVQDSIIGWQLDQGFHDSDYVHRHVLRDALNGAWGEEVATGDISKDTTFQTKFAYTIPAEINGIPTDPHHMYILAYIYNATTYEVLQAEEAKVMP